MQSGTADGLRAARGEGAERDQVKTTNLHTRKLTRSVSSSSFIVAAPGPAMRRSGGAVRVAGRAERVDYLGGCGGRRMGMASTTCRRIRVWWFEGEGLVKSGGEESQIARLRFGTSCRRRASGRARMEFPSTSHLLPARCGPALSALRWGCCVFSPAPSPRR